MNSGFDKKLQEQKIKEKCWHGLDLKKNGKRKIKKCQQVLAFYWFEYKLLSAAVPCSTHN